MDARAQGWLTRDPDPNTRAALERLIAANDTKAIDELFGGRLSFGTAGLRGVLGPGPMRMNRLVVRETTAGLAAYLTGALDLAKQRGVVVGYDGRVLSREFAADTASVLAGCGVRVYLCDAPQPTPLCAFAVVELGAAAGVVVTASHNPREYNGYKVYWGNGAQIIPPHDTGIAVAIDAAARVPIPWCELALARQRGWLVDLGDDMVQRYLAVVAALSIHPRDGSDSAPGSISSSGSGSGSGASLGAGLIASSSLRSKSSSGPRLGASADPGSRSRFRACLGIAYTPLHGVGAALAEAALHRAGFTNVHTVASQRRPDGSFPTIRFPNPEEPGTMDAVMALASETKAELAAANDPDADRFAVAVRSPDGSYRKLSGNEIGCLLGWDRMQAAPPNALVITSIISSRLLGVLARAHGVAYAETLTGFKWIANEAMAREAGGARFIFGYEEAYGYTVGTLVRDKDGISALVAFAELTAMLADRGQTVLDLRERLMREHGLYVTTQRGIATAGGNLGEALRAAPPVAIAGRAVRKTIDLLRPSLHPDLPHREGTAPPETTTLPPADVLIYELEGEARVTVRPSGTEPKIKCYYELRETVDPAELMATADARAWAAVTALADAHQAMLPSVGG